MTSPIHKLGKHTSHTRLVDSLFFPAAFSVTSLCEISIMDPARPISPLLFVQDLSTSSHVLAQ